MSVLGLSNGTLKTLSRLDSIPVLRATLDGVYIEHILLSRRAWSRCSQTGFTGAVFAYKMIHC